MQRASAQGIAEEAARSEVYREMECEKWSALIVPFREDPFEGRPLITQWADFRTSTGLEETKLSPKEKSNMAQQAELETRVQLLEEAKENLTDALNQALTRIGNLERGIVMPTPIVTDARSKVVSVSAHYVKTADGKIQVAAHSDGVVRS